MIVFSHPVGNANVRNALAAISNAGLLECFSTTVFWDKSWSINKALPGKLTDQLNRRAFPQVPNDKIAVTPLRESARLLSVDRNWRFFYESHSAFFSVNRVYRGVDRHTARLVKSLRPKAVYAYEGIALRTFQAAREQGIKCIYELPTGYWYYKSELLLEEADRCPEYAGTIARFQSTSTELSEKDEEIRCADHIVVPSGYVKDTLSRLSIPDEKVNVIPYGTNPPPLVNSRQKRDVRLRVLFVGGLTQLKGIGYLLEAVRTLKSAVSLTLIGRKVGRCKAIDKAVIEHTWHPTLPHYRVLEAMDNHDVLVLPSLTEGFGLVITEALSRGLPVIATANSGGPELITNGKDGFIVPIRSSESIARHLEKLAEDRPLLEEMSRSAASKAGQITWKDYQERLLSTLTRILQNA